MLVNSSEMSSLEKDFTLIRFEEGEILLANKRTRKVYVYYEMED